MAILRHLHIRVLVALGLMLAVIILPAAYNPARSDQIKLSEQKIKAGLIYNFLKYASWPGNALNDPESPIEICLMGGDPFDGYLHPLQGRTAQQHVINIRIIRGVSGSSGCHFIFIDSSLREHMDDILQALKHKPMILASDIPGFSRKGGMIEFAMKEQRVHLFVNPSSLNNSGIVIQDRLLKLAEVVR